MTKYVCFYLNHTYETQSILSLLRMVRLPQQRYGGRVCGVDIWLLLSGRNSSPGLRNQPGYLVDKFGCRAVYLGQVEIGVGEEGVVASETTRGKEVRQSCQSFRSKVFVSVGEGD